MDYRLPLWAALFAGAAIFIGCGIFFAFQDLGTANDYATIASFFLALLTAAGSLVSFVRSKQTPETAQGEAAEARASAGNAVVILGHVDTVLNGDHTQANVSIQHVPPDTEPSKKRRK